MERLSFMADIARLHNAKIWSIVRRILGHKLHLPCYYVQRCLEYDIN